MSENIKNLRKSKGLTQVQLAEKLGVTQPTVANYEKGSRTIEAEKIPKLAGILGCTSDEILGISESDKIIELPSNIIHGNSRIAQMNELFEKLGVSDQRAILKQVKTLLQAQEQEATKKAS